MGVANSVDADQTLQKASTGQDLQSLHLMKDCNGSVSFSFEILSAGRFIVGSVDGRGPPYLGHSI